MLRMEIALFLLLVLVGYTYFSSERRNTALHQTFSLLLIVLQIHLLFDAATVYTVNHLDTVPVLLNDQLHRAFIGSMVLAVFLFYQYISILAEEETARPRRLDRAAKIFLLLALAGDLLLPVHYAQTPQGNYSDGIHVVVCYLSVLYYLILCVVLLLGSYELKSRMSEKNAVIANLQEQIDQQIQESEQLLRESEYVKTEEYIEQIAREKLGLVKKNEIIFKKE